MISQSPTTRLTRIALFAALAALAAVVLAGCSGAEKAETPVRATESPAVAEAPAPTIELTEPLAGATVLAGEVPVNVKTTNLKFASASNTNVPGEGHVHYTLDDRPFVMSITPDAVLKDVEPGTHKLVAELVQNNTQPFNPPVLQEIEFTVE